MSVAIAIVQEYNQCKHAGNIKYLKYLYQRYCTAMV